MPRRNFLLILAWDGSDFEGWQRLPGEARSVQGSVEAALSTALGEPLEVVGAGRTDRGVHAEGQAASFHSRTGLTPASILAALNRELPPDLVARSCREVDPRFHARFRAKGKVYRYRLHVGDLPDPFFRRYSHHVAPPLDLAAMEAAGALLVGERDFGPLSNEKERKETVRRLTAVRVEARALGAGVAGPVLGSLDPGIPALVDLCFEGAGFLHNQVRIMAALLLEAGQGKRSLASVEALLAGGRRAEAPGALGPWGLCLLELRYGGSEGRPPAPPPSFR